MLQTLDIHQACEVLERYAAERGMDEFDALEEMVGKFRELDKIYQQALCVFMDYGKK